MEDLERILEIFYEKKRARQRELERLDTEPADYQELMSKLRDTKKETSQHIDNITKHLNKITAHKHSIHKNIHSSEEISGLPIPCDYAQDIKTMMTDAINFMNNTENTRMHNIITENDMDPSKLIQAVITCTEAVGNELYQAKCRVAQLETLKEDAAMLQQHMLNSNTMSDESDLTINSKSIDNESIIQ